MVGVFFTLNVTAQTQVNSTIQKVTVFTEGAQVIRTATVELNAGETELLITGLSPYINAQSIIAGLSNDVTILSVNQGVDYLSPKGRTAEIMKLVSDLQILQDKAKLEQRKLKILDKEEELLDNNRSLRGTTTNLKAIEIKETADLYRSRLTEIGNMRIELERTNQKTEEAKEKIIRQLNELKSIPNEPTGVIKLRVLAKKTTTTNLKFSYTVSNASWTPFYDIRVTDIKSPVTIVYKANVVQDCGENWSKVQLVLSTANPSQYGVIPPLVPYNLEFIDLNPPMPMEDAAVKFVAPVVVDDSESLVMVQSEEEKENVLIKETTAEFEIKHSANIPTDNKDYSLNIAEFTIPANYEYQCIPKLDADAFLSAKITGWEEYNLQNGDVNLYFEGTYVGSSYLNTKNATDTMTISLGRDKGISVKRTMIKDYSATQLLSSQRKDTRTWEITMRNSKSQKIDLILNDQIPISSNSEIIVEKGEISNAKFDENTGRLTWNISLEPKETKVVRFSYSVKYPKKNRIYLE